MTTRRRHLDTRHDATKLASSQTLEAAYRIGAATLEAGGIVDAPLRARRLAELRAAHPLTEEEQQRLVELTRQRALAAVAIAPKPRKGRASQ